MRALLLVVDLLLDLLLFSTLLIVAELLRGSADAAIERTFVDQQAVEVAEVCLARFVLSFDLLLERICLADDVSLDIASETEVAPL
jgi:hypothetical protein